MEQEYSQCVVEVIITDSQNKILLLKRSDANNFFKKFWQLPGGKKEINESTEKAVMREVLEETNCLCTDLKETNRYFFDSSFNGFEGSLELIVYTGSLKECVIKLSKDHYDYGFFSKEEIKKMHLTTVSKKSIFG